jgi:hypothetical protein
MRKQTNTLSPSPKGFQSPKFSESDFREIRGLGLGRPKSSDKNPGNRHDPSLEMWVINVSSSSHCVATILDGKYGSNEVKCRSLFPKFFLHQKSQLIQNSLAREGSLLPSLSRMQTMLSC